MWLKSYVAVTTLKDARKYPKDEIADLYSCRWQAELDIRAIKTTMGMDILRCKTPEMVRKEMWTCLLAYNLIRRAMLQSAQVAGLSPRMLSFTAALQTIGANWLIMVLGDDTLTSQLVDVASATMALHVVGNRPGRAEPRAIAGVVIPERQTSWPPRTPTGFLWYDGASNSDCGLESPISRTRQWHCREAPQAIRNEVSAVIWD